jgi:hypothetical protein
LSGDTADWENEAVSNRAVFRLFGDSEGTLSAALVTQKLGIKPTAAIEAGRLLGHSGCMWFLRTSPEVQDEWKAASHLAGLLAVLEPRADVLRELADMGYRARWECRIQSHYTPAVVEIDHQLMARLLALSGDLRVYVSGDVKDA